MASKALQQKLSVAVARTVLSLPPRLAKRFARPPVRTQGQTLDPHLQILLKLGQSAPDGFERSESVAAARTYYEGVAKLEAPVPACTSRDMHLDVNGTKLPIRTYRAPSTPAQNASCVVYFHGGGFVIGSLDTHENTCRRIAHRTGAVVVSVDYRLGPEHVFPTGHEDARAATEWVLENAASLGVDPQRVAVAGDSAGGNLAASVSQQVAGLKFALLIYPTTDQTVRVESRSLFGQGFALDETSADWCFSLYQPEGSDPRISPRVGDFSRVPPTHIAIAGFDILRDEALEYAEALEAAGVPVTRTLHASMVHGFIHMTRTKSARDATNDAIDMLRRGLDAPAHTSPSASGPRAHA